jgi:cell division protein FtsL
MKKLILFATAFLFFLTVQVSFAQTRQEQEIKDLQGKVQKIETANKNLKIELKKVRTLAEKKTSKVITDNRESSDETSGDKSAAETKTVNTGGATGKNALYWMLAVLSIALLGALLYVSFRKQLTKEIAALSDNIQQTKKALEEDGIKLDNKLMELVETHMQLVKSEPKPAPAKTEDHSLALKVADEVIRIQNNLSYMDPEIKGLKQLAAAVKRIQDNFEAFGYELVDMRNKPYDEGMKVIANFKPDENLKEGEQIITRIIKPQVNYKGVMIQSAQVEVSVG